MSAFKELLTQLAADQLLDDEIGGKLSEAYEFDVSDYAEQVGTLTGEREAGSAALAERDAIIAALRAEITDIKAMNFDKLMSGNTTEADDTETNDDDDAGAPVSLDDLIAANTTFKE